MTPPIRGGANPFGPGLGGRLGVSFGAFYVGAAVVDYFGSTDVDLTAHAFTYGGEVGYGINLGRGFSVRPTLGVGGLTALYSTPITSSSSTTGTSSARTQSVQPVDVITTASTSAGGASSGGLSSLFGGDPSSNTTSSTAFYVQPGVTVLLASSWGFVAAKGSAMVVPTVADGVGGTETWLMWGMDAELGLRF